MTMYVHIASIAIKLGGLHLIPSWSNISKVLMNKQHIVCARRVSYLFSDTMYTWTLVLVNCWTESYENWSVDTLHVAKLDLQV